MRIRSGLMRRRRLIVLLDGPSRPSPNRSSRHHCPLNLAWRAMAQSLQIDGENIRQAQNDQCCVSHQCPLKQVRQERSTTAGVFERGFGSGKLANFHWFQKRGFVARALSSGVRGIANLRRGSAMCCAETRLFLERSPELEQQPDGK